MVKNPTYWGKDAAGNQLPYLDQVTWVMVQDESAANLQLQSGAVDFQPQTVFQGSQALFADPNLRVDIYPGTRHPRGRVQPAAGPLEERNKELRQAVAYCLDREAINQALYDGRSNLGYDTFWEPSVFPGSPRACRARSGLRQGQAAAGRRRLQPRHRHRADRRQVPGEPAVRAAHPGPVQAGRHQRQAQSDQLRRLLRRRRATSTPWLNADMVIVEWGSRPTPGVYAQAMLLPTSTWSSSHWDNAGFQQHVRSVHVDHGRGQAHRVRDEAVAASSRTIRRSCWPSSSPSCARRRRTCTASRAPATSTAS